MKRKFIRLFVFLGFILSFVFVGISSLAATASMENGARIRTTGNQGLMFTATVDSLEDTLGHGFYVVLGEHTAEAISNAVNNQETKVDGNVLKKVAVEGENTTFKVVVYNINEAYYEQKITAVSYVETESGVEVAAASVTRSIGQVARGLYNEDNNVDSYIANIAKKGAIKVEGSSKDRYYNSLSEVVFEDGDTINLPAGTYADNFTINANNVTILGPNAEKAGTSNERTEEAVLTGVVTLGANGITLNGLSFNNKAQLASSNTLDNINIVYNYFSSKITGTNLFMLNRTSEYYDDLVIANNYFEYDLETIENSPTNLLYISNVRNIAFTNNTFNNIKENAIFIHDGSGFGLYGNNNNFTNNTFNNVGGKAININYYASISGTIDGVLNIRSNEFKNVACGIYLADCDSSVKYDEVNISANTFSGAIDSCIEIHGLPGRIDNLNIAKFNLVDNIFESVPTFTYFNLSLTGANGNKYNGLISVQNNYYGETGVPASYGSKFVNVKMFEYDYVVDKSYTTNNEKVNFNNVEYIVGETAFSSIKGALDVVSEGKTIYVAKGTYTEDLEINYNNISLVGPNMEIDGNYVDRNEEASITGTITVKANIAGLSIKGFKFEDNAKIVSTGSGKIYVDKFEFINNVVESTLTNDSFINFQNGTYDAPSTDYSEYMVIKNNKFTGNLDNTSVFIYLGDNSKFTFVNNTFTNIGGTVLKIDDAARGLVNKANIDNNSFDNIKSNVIEIDWWGNTTTGEDISICGNTFTNITGKNIVIGGSNASTKVNSFIIKNNVFSDTVANSLSIKDGSITSTKVTTIDIQE